MLRYILNPFKSVNDYLEKWKTGPSSIRVILLIFQTSMKWQMCFKALEAVFIGPVIDVSRLWNQNFQALKSVFLGPGIIVSWDTNILKCWDAGHLSIFYSQANIDYIFRTIGGTLTLRNLTKLKCLSSVKSVSKISDIKFSESLGSKLWENVQSYF